MTLRDHRKTLGVSEMADAQEIKAAYKALAKKYHPDTNGGDAEAERKFKEINAAYQALKDAGYVDKSGSSSSAPGKASGGFSFEDSEIFDSIFGMMRERMRSQGHYHGMDPGFGYESRSDGKASESRNRSTKKGADVEDTADITLEQAFTGAHVVMDGKGGDKIRIKIPAGIMDGAQLRVRGHGEAGTGGGENGDLIVTLRLREHERFSLDGRNLRTRLDVPFTLAVSGGSIEFQHLDGKKHIIDVPAFWKGETTLVAKGSGWPAKDPSSVGHLLIDLKAILPVNLSERQRKLLAEFDQTVPEYRSERLASSVTA
jgi:DnaJ-class molecular chaperone|nr:DnaJ C-terminal domain-containing protein [Neorhizobium tomejilense]